MNIYDLKDSSKIFKFSIPQEVPMNFLIIDNMIVLNFFKPIISFIMDLDPIHGFFFIPPFVINKKETSIKNLGNLTD